MVRKHPSQDPMVRKHPAKDRWKRKSFTKDQDRTVRGKYTRKSTVQKNAETKLWNEILEVKNWKVGRASHIPQSGKIRRLRLVPLKKIDGAEGKCEKKIMDVMLKI